MKKIISALVAGSMLLSATPALASDINITIDGEKFIPKNALGEVVNPFIENGSTYLPVRAIGEAVGKEVSFDPDNYAVYIGVKPMAEDVETYPYIMIEDKVYTEGFMHLGYRTDDFVVGYKLEKLVKEKIAAGILTEADVLNTTKEIMEMQEITEENISQVAKALSVTESELRKQITQLAYEKCLLNSVEVDESIYDNYVTVKHIFTTNLAVAETIIQALNNGESFESLLEQYNEDPGQTVNSTYTFTYGEMVEDFETAAFELNVNEYTKVPVESSYGYHVILRLPLIEVNVPVDGYKVAVISEELYGISDPEKIVFISNEGDVYGEIDGVEITSKEFELMGIALDTMYAEGFEGIKELFAVGKVCEEGYLSEMELAAAKDVDVSAHEPSSQNFMRRVLESYNMLTMVDEKLNGDQNAYSEFFVLLDEAQRRLDTKINRDIRVYVDGSLIIPSDVNNNYVNPMNIEGTVYVPVRAIVEALGMSAEWDNDTRTVVIDK